jgi:hypothetical protein
MARRGGRKAKAGVQKYLEDHPGETILTVKSCLIQAHSCWSTSLCMGMSKTWRRLCITNAELVKYITQSQLAEMLRDQHSACGVSQRVAMAMHELDAEDLELLNAGKHVLATNSGYPLRRLLLSVHSTGDVVVVLDKARSAPKEFWVAVMLRIDDHQSRKRRIFFRSRINEFVSEIARDMDMDRQGDRARVFTCVTDQSHDDLDFKQWNEAKQTLERSGHRLFAHPYGLQSQKLQVEAEISIALVKRFIRKHNYRLVNGEEMQAVKNYLQSLDR